MVLCFKENQNYFFLYYFYIIILIKLFINSPFFSKKFENLMNIIHIFYSKISSKFFKLNKKKLIVSFHNILSSIFVLIIQNKKYKKF